MPTRLCLQCHQLTSKPTRRGLCRECDRQQQRSRPARSVYDTVAWRRLAARVVREHLATVGPWCPGYGREGHVALDLTADHRVPIAGGGAPYDRANIMVLCRSCNGRKAANTPATRCTR